MRRELLTIFVVFALAGIGPHGALAGDAADLAQLQETGECPGCNLSAEELGGMNLEDADLAGASLLATSLYKTNLQMADLSGADLTGADFTEANLGAANLGNAFLYAVDLSSANLEHANLAGASTDDTTICPDGQVGPCGF